MVESTESAHSHCVLDPACGAREVFEVVTGRWGPLAIMALLGRNGLVEREVHPVVPQKFEYSLTPLGASLQHLLEAVCQWSERLLAEFEETRLASGEGILRCARGNRTDGTRYRISGPLRMVPGRAQRFGPGLAGTSRNQLPRSRVDRASVGYRPSFPRR